MNNPNFWLALRFIRAHRAEAAASILMAALASLLSVATAAGIILYDAGAEASLEKPGYLEITVSPFIMPDTDVAATPVEDKKPDPDLLSIALIGDVLATCPSVRAGWQSSSDVLTATDNPDADLAGRTAGMSALSGRSGAGLNSVAMGEVRTKQVPAEPAAPGPGPETVPETSQADVAIDVQDPGASGSGGPVIRAPGTRKIAPDTAVPPSGSRQDSGPVLKTPGSASEKSSDGRALPGKRIADGLRPAAGEIPPGKIASGTASPSGADGEAVFRIPDVSAAGPADQDASGPIDIPMLTEIPVKKVTPGFFTAYGLKTGEGALFTQQDMDANRPLLVLGSALARRLFEDGKAYGRRARFDGVIYTVAGILEPVPSSGPGRSLDDTAFVSPAGFPTVLSDGSVFMKFGVKELSFMPENGAHADRAFRELTAFMEQTFGPGVVTIRTPRKDLLEQKTMIDRIFTLTGILALLCLSAGALNTLGLSYLKTERMKVGLGITRAGGAAWNDVLSVFAVESTMLSLLGTVPGSVAGFLLALFFTGLYFPGGTGTAEPALIPAAFGAAILSLIIPVVAVLIPVSGSTAARSTGFMVRE